LASLELGHSVRSHGLCAAKLFNLSTHQSSSPNREKPSSVDVMYAASNDWIITVGTRVRVLGGLVEAVPSVMYEIITSKPRKAMCQDRRTAAITTCDLCLQMWNR